MEEIIIDYKKCPCYINRPLYRYDKGCLIQSQAFTEQQTKEKPILRCDEIINCPIKENYKQLKRLEQENEKLKKQIEYDSRYNDMQAEIDCGERIITQYKHALEEIKIKWNEFKKLSPLEIGLNQELVYELDKAIGE